MFKYCLPLALIFGWMPNAYAFPPCPVAPVSVDPIDPPLGMTKTPEGPTNPPWYRTTYAFVGNPAVIDLLQQQTIAETAERRSKCRDRIPVMQGHASTGIIGLSPAYAPVSGFGLIALPDLRDVRHDLGEMGHDLDVPYTLNFSIENQPLAHPGEWVDLIQLTFRWNDEAAKRDASAIYRIRKLQHSTGQTLLQVVESRVDGHENSGDTRPPIHEWVAASITLDTGMANTPVQLQWSQTASQDVYESPDAPSIPRSRVDSVLKVISRGETLYRIDLYGQWADTLSIGLLDYNITGENKPGIGAVLDNVFFSDNPL
jgi:hypothetical protein